MKASVIGITGGVLSTDCYNNVTRFVMSMVMKKRVSSYNLEGLGSVVGLETRYPN